MKIELRNGADVKHCKTGFSVTTFFFGFFVPLFRLDIKHFFIFLILNLFGFITAFFTFGLSALIINLIICMKYNKWYIQDLLKKGYQPTDDLTRNWLKAEGFLF